MTRRDRPGAPLPVDSISELLERNAASFGDKDAIVAVGPDSPQVERISHRKLWDLVHQTAAFLLSAGIGKSNRFAILMHNCPEVLLFELAGALIGATTVPLDFKRDILERKLFKLRDTKAQGLFVRTEDGNVSDIAELTKQLPALKVVSWASMSEFEALVRTKPPYSSSITTDLSNHYLILYTSGTTALPKGAVLTTRACLTNAMGIVDWQRFTSEDRFNIILPLHHINSTEFCLSMLLVGGTLILNSRYSASKFWDIVASHKATNTSIVPTVLHDLLVRRDEFAEKHLDVSHLRRICIGSAPVLPEETLRFYKTFGIRVVQGYGQTETALRVAGVPPDVDDEAYEELVRSNTIGRELANNTLAIMDENNNPQKEGAHGEICIAGPILAEGYLNNPKETKLAFKGGWFHSGDLGYWKYLTLPGRKPEKFYFIIGRLKEIIIKGGVNLSPSAIEDALLKAFPQIDEVSVVGYPDSRMGEEVAAVVVLQSTKSPLSPKDIVDAGAGGTITGISAYEVPKHVFIADKLPKTSTGKIQRVEVKKMVAAWAKGDTQKHYFIRRIDPGERDNLAQAVAINNDRWHGLTATVEEFAARGTNGLLFGCFEEKEGLVGTLSCVQLDKSVVEKLKTWDEATSGGTLANHDPKGDTLLCVAISVRSSSNSPTMKHSNHIDDKQLKLLSKKHIEEYVNSDRDHVLNFHRKPKGGLPGATVWKILEAGRPDDTEAMGYNVLMRYPSINQGAKIIRSNAPAPSILLIEHALLYVKKYNLANVIAFSRPAGFGKYLTEISGKTHHG